MPQPDIVIFTTHMEDGWIAEAIEGAETDGEDVLYSSEFHKTEKAAIADVQKWLRANGRSCVLLRREASGESLAAATKTQENL